MYKALQPKLRSMTMFDDLDSLRTQFSFMNFRPEIVQWDKNLQ